MEKKEKIQLKANVLYLLSAVPASGKGTFLKNNNIPESMIVNPDQLRLDILGEIKSYDENGLYGVPNFQKESNVWKVTDEILKARLSQHLTTFLDSTLSKDEDRVKYSKMASEYGMKTEVLILDVPLEVCLEQDKNRHYRVGKDCIESFYENFDRESVLNYHLIDSQTKAVITPNMLPHDKVDVIGDIHGLLDETIDFLTTQLNYEINKYGVLVNKIDSERKVFFMGDFIDRGKQSIEALIFVKKQVDNGHFAIGGNHENKLINFYKSQKNKSNDFKINSRAGALTAMSFMKLKEDEQKELFTFLLDLPSYYVYDDIAFCHAHVQHFDPLLTTRNSMLYGDRRRDDRTKPDYDLNYSKGYVDGINKYKLIRAHQPYTNVEQKHVISIEEQAPCAGNLNVIKLDDVIKNSNDTGVFNNPNLILRYSVDYDHRNELANSTSLYRTFQNMEKDGLASSTKDESGLLKIYKYQKSVFFKRRWNENESLLKCRGLVFDLAGNIIQHPFDKVFNYQEPNEKDIPTGEFLDDDNQVQMVEKLNGFLGCITKHPFKNELLITTTGSFDKNVTSQNTYESDFVGYIKELVYKNNHYSTLMKYFHHNQDITLMFEVIHGSDPHIIEYNDNEHDIYLIGARKKEIDSKVLSEKEMDELASELSLKRPNHFIVSFSEAKDIVRKTHLEGHMIRDPKTNDYILKFKSPYYLCTKFLGRMSSKNINFMFASPEEFKKRMDEEFYYLVDVLTERFTKEDFSLISDADKIIMVRGLVEEMRNKNSTSNIKAI